nr:unnamed protein product [Callosobruchus chinensis]
MNFYTIKVQRKINLILALFRRERQKESMAKTSGSGYNDMVRIRTPHPFSPFFI